MLRIRALLQFRWSWDMLATSESGASRTSAFFSPSGLIRTLTLVTSVSRGFFTARLIWCVVALTPRMSGRVCCLHSWLWSEGAWWWRSVQACSSRGRSSEGIGAAAGAASWAAGGWVRVFCFLWLWTHFSTACMSFGAFALTLALGGAESSFYTFCVILVKKPWLVLSKLIPVCLSFLFSKLV